ncbi:MAG: hypothetical protein ACE5I3_08435 [Phycisphaerae bacterium]
MSASFARQITRWAGGHRWGGAVAALVGGLLLGCDGEASSTAKSGGKAPEPSARPQQRLPTYDFAEGLRAAYPDAGAFVEEFLNTCLVGDYAGYRRLVSRAYTPESRERFEAIYQATEAVTVESIELIDIPRIPPPVYRVVSSVELNPQQQIRRSETRRKVAIVVFKEGEDWRMAPAPAELQPRDEPPPTAAATLTTTAPAYPWDEDGDY